MPAAESSEEYQVQLPEFEGPLDLLLHLVKRHELSIVEIPIAFITEKYLEYLELMRALNIDVAGEYLLMAATLAHIKSRELLPRNEAEDADADDEEEQDTRESLIRRLLEYQRYKEAAQQLAARPQMGRQVFGRGVDLEPPDPAERPLAEVSTFALITALAEMFKRNKIRASYEITIDRISITDRINEIVDRLIDQASVPFLECFQLAGAPPRREIVVTLLAVLELARLGMIRLLQQELSSPIYLSRTDALHRVDDQDVTFTE